MAATWWRNMHELSLRARRLLVRVQCPLETREGAKAFVRNAVHDGTICDWQGGGFGPRTIEALSRWAEVNELSAEPAACKTCRFWLWDDTDKRLLGFCRRYPPLPGDYNDSESSVTQTGYPMTLEEDWCGEHQFRT